jgi:SET domain-containing protein
MPHTHSDLIMVKRAPKKGRGVFARKPIAKGTVIERVPVILVPVQEIFNPDRPSVLADYVFAWGRGKVAVALGYGSLYNHSYRPNARFLHGAGPTKVFKALRDIERGEEITVNYNGPPGNGAPVGFRAI